MYELAAVYALANATGLTPTISTSFHENHQDLLTTFPNLRIFPVKGLNASEQCLNGNDLSGAKARYSGAVAKARFKML